ncbi:unnamed protein product [Nezara viridula]|uniref:Uncharacterized protein n=1 Tax=Nezara viridula TaxID=85310 RepID=A0A9P0HU23_NEZVI|nr:unnamed protein product [Nezara viridula]
MEFLLNLKLQTVIVECLKDVKFLFMFTDVSLGMHPIINRISTSKY